MFGRHLADVIADGIGFVNSHDVFGFDIVLHYGYTSRQVPFFLSKICWEIVIEWTYVCDCSTHLQREGIMK